MLQGFHEGRPCHALLADAGATAQVAWNSAAATERKRCDLSMRSRNGCCAASQKTVKHLKQTNPDRVDAFKAVSDARWSEGSAFALLTAYNRVPRARRPP